MGNFLKSVWQRVLACFLAGVLAILPLVVTVAVVIWVAGFVEGFIGPNTGMGKALSRLGWRFADDAEDTVTAYLTGWIVVLAVIFAFGVVLQLGAKRLFQTLTDSLLHRIPLVSIWYDETICGLAGQKQGR